MGARVKEPGPWIAGVMICVALYIGFKVGASYEYRKHVTTRELWEKCFKAWLKQHPTPDEVFQ